MTDGHRVYGLEVTHEDVSEVKDRSSFNDWTSRARRGGRPRPQAVKDRSNFNDWFNRTKECTPYPPKTGGSWASQLTTAY